MRTVLTILIVLNAVGWSSFIVMAWKRRRDPEIQAGIVAGIAILVLFAVFAGFLYMFSTVG